MLDADGLWNGDGRLDSGVVFVYLIIYLFLKISPEKVDFIVDYIYINVCNVAGDPKKVDADPEKDAVDPEKGRRCRAVKNLSTEPKKVGADLGRVSALQERRLRADP